MQTKSNIQLIREGLAILEAFKENIKSFMEKYTIEDNYFGPSYRISPNSIKESQSVVEYTQGYFVFEHEYTDIDNAISNMSLDQSIRIIENKRFQIGKIYEKLSDAKGDKIIDITNNTQIL